MTVSSSGPAGKAEVSPRVHSGDDRRGFTEFRKEDCPVCGHRGWCAKADDGSVIICRRKSQGAAFEGTDRNGATYYVHLLTNDGDGDSDDKGKPLPKRSGPLPKPAGVEVRDEVYRALLGYLTLDAHHREELKLRGLTEAEIDDCGYRTLRKNAAERRKRLERLAGEFGETVLLTVPGLALDDRKKLTICAPPGLLIPVRNVAGQTVALRVKPEKKLDGGSKYIWLSSASRGGPSSGSQCHVPNYKDPANAIRLTEGELKADIATHRGRMLCLSAPGVSNWNVALPAIRDLGCRTVRVAFDSDGLVNAVVALATVNCCRGLAGLGLNVEIERWHWSDGKGIDDVLVSGKPVEVLTGDRLDAYLDELAGRFELPAKPHAVATGNGRAGGNGKHEPGGNGDGKHPEKPPPEEPDPIRPNESADDPSRLARLFIEGRCRHRDGLTLRYWQGNCLGWDGGAYRAIPDDDVRAQIHPIIKGEFDHLNVEEIAQWERDRDGDQKAKKGPPKALKVTRNLVADTVLALSGYTRLAPRTPQPSWLDGPGPFPADDVLPARNALVHLPGFVAGDPGSVIPPTPRFFCPYSLDYDFDPDVSRPGRWLAFLESLSPDDPELSGTLQEWFGYLLTPDTSHQKILMMIGPKRSGRGTIARVIRGLIGPENVANPTLSGLATNFGVAPLIGKPAAVITDARMSGRTDVAQVVERLLAISGEDAQTIDRKHLAAVTVKLPTRFAIISNELPKLTDASGALPSRLIVLPMTRTFYGKEDRGLTAALLAELPGILLWAIEGWRRLRERGWFVQPAAGKALVEAMEDLASPTGAFLKDRCRIEPGVEVMAAELYREWKDWCQEHGRDKPGDEQVFGRNLRAILPGLKTTSRRQPDGTRKRFYEGIGLFGPVPKAPEY
jgi:putative DNA primase/helicase